MLIFGVSTGARLIVLREDQLVEGNEGTGRRSDDGVDFGFREFHAEGS
jgi:hypothetical protein